MVSREQVDMACDFYDKGSEFHRTFDLHSGPMASCLTFMGAPSPSSKFYLRHQEDVAPRVGVLYGGTVIMGGWGVMGGGGWWAGIRVPRECSLPDTVVHLR